MHKITLFSKVEGKLGEGRGRVMMLKQLMFVWNTNLAIFSCMNIHAKRFITPK